MPSVTERLPSLAPSGRSRPRRRLRRPGAFALPVLLLAGGLVASAQNRPTAPPFFESAGRKKRDPNAAVIPPFFGEVKPPKPIVRTPATRPGPRTRPAATGPATRPATAPAPRTRPATAPATRPRPATTQPIRLAPAPLADRVERAIRRGLDWLYATQRPDGTWDSKYAAQHPGGVEALVVWTALAAGEPSNHPQLAAAMQYAEKLTPRTTYVRAVRALASSRLSGPQGLDLLQEDATWLADNQSPTGGWGYGPGYRTTRENPAWTDLSNTFLALRALHDAENAGAKVPPNVWNRSRVYLSRSANADGGLGYQPPGGVGFRLRGSSYGSMTAAATAAMFLLADRAYLLGEADFVNSAARRSNPSPFAKHVERAVGWLGGNLAFDRNPRWVWGLNEAYEYYYLWCLQQLAAHGGLAELAGKRFVRPALERVVSRQQPDGQWLAPGGDGKKDRLAVLRTCFALLSLLEVRGPVLIDKRALGPKAANDPRDAANLTRWLGRTFHWPAAWRDVPPNAPPTPGTSAPLLYVQTSLTEYPAALDAVVREHLAGGGTIVLQPFAAEPAAVQAATEFLRRALPDLTLGEVGDTHPVFSVHFKIPPASRPKMLGLHDACRTRVFVLTEDVSGAWHQMRVQTHRHAFQLGANLLLYTTDLTPPRGRLAVSAARPAAPKPARTVRLARVRYDGAWNVAPRAFPRLGEVLAEALSVGVRELPPVALDKPVDRSVPLLWLTGTGTLKLSDAQKPHLKNYVAGGGMLLVDAAMGDLAFAGAAAELLTDLFGAGRLLPLAPDHPLLTGAFAGGMGSNVTRVGFTRAAAAEVGEAQPPKLLAIRIDGRVAVVFSPYSVTCPLQGRPVYNCKGLAPADAARLAANVVLYAATNRAD